MGSKKRQVRRLSGMLCFRLHSRRLTARSPQRVRWSCALLPDAGQVMGALTKVFLPWQDFLWYLKVHLCGLVSVLISCRSVAIGPMDEFPGWLRDNLPVKICRLYILLEWYNGSLRLVEKRSIDFRAGVLYLVCYVFSKKINLN